jgi:ElaA protein
VTVTLHHGRVETLDPAVLYAVLRLRVDVFVVEQECAYEELDGRDLEPDAELMWIAEGDDVLATLRVLADDGAMRIGRVATAAAARGRGLAAELMRAAVAYCDDVAPGAPIVLDAQAQLEGWYARFGFVVSGESFAEDGIPHLPMRRP